MGEKLGEMLGLGESLLEVCVVVIRGWGRCWMLDD